MAVCTSGEGRISVERLKAYVCCKANDHIILTLSKYRVNVACLSKICLSHLGNNLVVNESTGYIIVVPQIIRTRSTLIETGK